MDLTIDITWTDRDAIRAAWAKFLVQTGWSVFDVVIAVAGVALGLLLGGLLGSLLCLVAGLLPLVALVGWLRWRRHAARVAASLGDEPVRYRLDTVGISGTSPAGSFAVPWTRCTAAHRRDGFIILAIDGVPTVTLPEGRLGPLAQELLERFPALRRRWRWLGRMLVVACIVAATVLSIPATVPMPAVQIGRASCRERV